MSNNDLLQTVCSDIYTLTGIKPVVYDADMQILYAHPLSMGPFCQKIRSDPAVARRCRACDRAGLERCRNTGEICIYHCHMGFTEAAAPILERGIVVGYLLFGQLLEEGNRCRVIEQLRSGMYKDPEILSGLLEAVPTTETATILACARLISMCASYIHLQRAVMQSDADMARTLDSYIRQNCARDLSIAHLCRRFGISRGTLYNISKRAFGTGITEYIGSCRVDAAIELLQQTDLTVSRIAELSGIHDANYLTKLIKKRTGLTPTRLRRSRNPSPAE